VIVQHAFTVNAPAERVLAALLDLRTTVGCLPGARLQAVEGDTAHGRVRVPLGAHTIIYSGTLQLVESDAEAGSLRAVLHGKQLNTGERASADVEVRLRESKGLTTASLRGDLRVDDGAAPLEPGEFQRAASALLRRFGRCLEEAMARGATPGAGVDPAERLEETIAALNQLEQLTARSAPVAPSPPEPPAAGSAPSWRGPVEDAVPGRVEVVTTGPVVVPRTPSRHQRSGDLLHGRRWLVPATLLLVLLGWVMLRRRG